MPVNKAIVRLIVNAARGDEAALRCLLRRSQRYVSNRFGQKLTADQCCAIANMAASEARAAAERRPDLCGRQIVEIFMKTLERERQSEKRQIVKHQSLLQPLDDWSEPRSSRHSADQGERLETQQVLDLALSVTFEAIGKELPNLSVRDQYMLIVYYQLQSHFAIPTKVVIPANPGTYRRALHRARERLRRLLQTRLTKCLEEGAEDRFVLHCALGIAKGERYLDAAELSQELAAAV